MRGLSRVVATIAVAGGLLAATTSAAHGQAYEPNDAFNQAYGPLVGGQNYDGQKETSNDQDWYFFNTTGQRQVGILRAPSRFTVRSPALWPISAGLRRSAA